MGPSDDPTVPGYTGPAGTDITCLECGKVFRARGYRRYCSSECSDAYYRKKVQQKKPTPVVPCQVCGKLLAPNGRSIDRRYCSKGCIDLAFQRALAEESERLEGDI